MSNNKIYCFRASVEHSTNFDRRTVPDWLCLEVDWQGFKISTNPWVADVARVLGVLQIEDSADGWICHLEGLGLKEVRQVVCEEFFEDRGYA